MDIRRVAASILAVAAVHPVPASNQVANPVAAAGGAARDNPFARPAKGYPEYAR
ncbi:hypothetical protein AB0K14_32995 [Actinosynnema sp. NPDC050801]|uniref:hypothetical protein n=1 Tax=unclassified Actinosynnema TaxID=2637065 RepID=UPI0034074E11